MYLCTFYGSRAGVNSGQAKASRVDNPNSCPGQMQFNSEKGPLQPVTAIFRLHDIHTEQKRERERDRERKRGEQVTARLVLWGTWTRLNGMPETGTK